MTNLKTDFMGIELDNLTSLTVKNIGKMIVKI